MQGRTRALLFSVDGMRPDGLAAAATPNIDRLIREGAYTPRARATLPTVTLPCHMSMLRGVDTDRHGITTNVFQPLARPVPSIIDAAHEQGLRTGFFNNWEELRDLSAPGSLDISVMYRDCDSAEGDRMVAQVAVEWMARLDLDLMVVYLGWPDACAHRHGWMSPQYLASLANADACLGIVLTGLERLGRAAQTVTLVTSDHGGHGRSHGSDCEEDVLIPWILHGPGVRRGHTIAGPIAIYDTCTTLAHTLGLTPFAEWDGRVAEEALVG